MRSMRRASALLRNKLRCVPGTETSVTAASPAEAVELLPGAPALPASPVLSPHMFDALPDVPVAVGASARSHHGGGGVSQVFNLAHAYAHSRTLRFADGPDEVHRAQIGRLELRRWN